MIREGIFLLLFNIKKTLQDYKQIFLIFVVPVIIITAAGIALNNENRIDDPTEKISVGIVDLEQSNLSSMLISTITEEKTLSNLMRFEGFSEEQAIQELKEKNIVSYIVIPESFSTGLLNMENPPLTIVNGSSTTIESFIIQKTVESFSEYVNYVEIATASEYYSLRDMEYSIEEASRVNDSVSFRLIMDTLSRKSLFDISPIYNVPSVSSLTYHGVSLLILILFYVTTLCALDIIKDIETKVIKKMLLSKVKTSIFFMSKNLAYTFFVTLWLSFVLFLYAKTYSADFDIKLLLLTFFSVGFALNSFWIFIGVIIKRKEAFLSFSSLLILIIAFAGGSFFPVILLPYSVSKYIQYMPNAIISKNIINLMMGSHFYYEQMVFIFFCLITGTAMILLASLILRRWE
jgi:ABC-2 type transport system permease protein